MLQLWLFANTILAQIFGRVGGLNLSLNVVVLLPAGIILARREQGLTLGALRVTAFLCAYFAFSCAIVLSGPCSAHPLKALITIPILLFLIITAFKMVDSSHVEDWLSLQRVVKWALVISFASFALEALRPSWFPSTAVYRADYKLSGIFPEPSHVAVSLFPCVAILLASENKKARRAGWLTILALLIVCRPTTLLVLILAWILYSAIIHGKIRQTGVVVLVVGVIVLAAVFIDYQDLVEPTVLRLRGVLGSTKDFNMSSLVYLQGWQDAWFNLKRTHGLGLGVNMMGCGALPEVLARRILAVIGLASKNAEDGSFLFSKVVSETGAAGILIYLAIIARWIYRERQTRKMSLGPEREAAGIQNALIFSFVVASFLRTSGYFDGIPLLGIAGLFAPPLWHRVRATRMQDGPNVPAASTVPGTNRLLSEADSS